MEKNNLTIKERASNFIQKLKKKNTSDDSKEDSKVEEVSKVRLSKHMCNYPNYLFSNQEKLLSSAIKVLGKPR